MIDMSIKLQKLPDRTPVKLAISVSPELNRTLQEYAQLYRQTYGQEESVAELIPFMLDRFLQSDKAFLKAQRKDDQSGVTPTNGGDRRTF